MLANTGNWLEQKLPGDPPLSPHSVEGRWVPAATKGVPGKGCLAFCMLMHVQRSRFDVY